MRETLVLYPMLIILVSICVSSSSFKATAINDIFAGKEPLGIPLEEWAFEYWKWWLTVPESVTDNASEKSDQCITGKDTSGRMLFLVNPYNYRDITLRCSISSESYILVPLLVGESDRTVPECSENRCPKIEDLWKNALGADEVFHSATVLLDNKKVVEKRGDKESNSTLFQDILVRNSKLFNLTVSEGNRYGLTPATYPAVVDGRYLVLQPLDSGEHTVSYDYTQKKSADHTGSADTDGSVTYIFEVK